MLLPERVARCIMLLATDRGCIPKNPQNWPGFIDYAWLENKLKPLDMGELKTLCKGEESEIIAVIEKHDIALVSEFLAITFDGDLHQFFYKQQLDKTT